MRPAATSRRAHSAIEGKRLAVRYLGLVDYGETLALQRRLVAERQREEIADTLLLLEHPPVITLGRGASESDILADQQQLAAAGVTLHTVERGGQVTYHGPGQLVGYCIVNLYERQRQLRRFVYLLEELFIDLLGKEYGVIAVRHERHHGVWIGNKKIVAIGLAILRGVTMHGFAFNVDVDLSHFGWIVPCGISGPEGLGQTSLSQVIRKRRTPADVQSAVAQRFTELFGYTCMV